MVVGTGSGEFRRVYKASVVASDLERALRRPARFSSLALKVRERRNRMSTSSMIVRVLVLLMAGQFTFDDVHATIIAGRGFIETRIAVEWTALKKLF